MTDRNETNTSPNLGRLVPILLSALFVGSIIWSFLYETLLPLWTAGDVRSIILHLVGFPIILAGAALFAYGGYLLVRDTFSAMADPHLKQNTATIKDDAAPAETVRRARWANARFLFRSWKPGALRMAAGFALIALGGWLINL